MKFSYDIVKYFKEEKYRGVIEYDDLQERKYFKTKIGSDIMGRAVYDELQGWLVHHEKEKIVLPETIDGKDIRQLLPIRITATEPFPHQTTIYQKPTKNGITSFKIPPKRCMSFKEMVDVYYEVDHTNQDQLKIYKLLVIGSYLLKFNWRVTTGAGFGKNGVVEVFSTLMRDCNVLSPKSDSRLMTMFDNRRLLVIDEWMDLDLSKKESLEYVFRGASDGRPDMINGALKSTQYKTKDSYNLTDLSIGFIYNTMDYYQPPNIQKDKRKEYFDNLYTLATRERFLPLHFDGRIDSTMFKVDNPKEEYKKHKDFLKDWVQTCKYFEEHFYEELVGKEKWEWEDLMILGGNKYNRMNNMLNTFRLVLKAYAQTEQEYNELCDLVLDRYIAYEHMLGKHIQKTIKEINVE